MEGLREPQGHRSRTPLQSRLEHHFERWLWRFRVIVVALIVAAFKAMLIFPIDNTSRLVAGGHERSH